MPRAHKISSVETRRSAQQARLRYVTDLGHGLQRLVCRRGFEYRNGRGKLIARHTTLRRITALAIPPAWKDVWICPDDKGHLQATGRDARGRKQYRYHPRWREIREETKYHRILEFARALKKIRQRVRLDLRAADLSKRQILAAVVQLLEGSLIRVGNQEYAEANHSYGLTTLKNRHARVHGSAIQFHFRGKSGKQHRIEVHDPRLARIVRQCHDLPGQDLFQYVDPEGKRHHIRSEQVNEYIREISGADFSAKDFRTWAGTVLASLALRQFQAFETPAQAKRNLMEVVKAVASRLGNTPAICRKCYIHPAILECYLQGQPIHSLVKSGPASNKRSPAFRAEETSVMKFLQNRLTRTADESRGFAL